MSAYKSDFLNILNERGFIHQCSDFEGLDALAAKGALVGYIGYDCTARSLHIGNYLTMMMLYWLQQSGNKPITLMGGGTTMVGDPSGKDESRPMRTVEEIEANKASIKTVFSRVLEFGDGAHDAIMVDNADWLLKLGYIDMLRDVGRHFSVNRMLSMDSVRLRLEREQEMSFIEFNYMVCQSYDYVELARRYGCNLQMGGSDQWGNIINGVELGRRMGTHQLYALTTPLLTTAVLANEATALLHGRAAAEEAAETARKTFEEGAISENLPTITVSASELDAGIGLLALFVRAGLAGSNGEARRHVQGGAIRINDISITDDKTLVDAGYLNDDGVIKLSLGKKKHVLVRPQ